MREKNEQLLIFSERLRNLIRARGIDQKGIAAAVGLTPTATSYYLREKRMPRASELFALSNYFGVGMGSFFAPASVASLHEKGGNYDASGRLLPRLEKIEEFTQAALLNLHHLENEVESLRRAVF